MIIDGLFALVIKILILVTGVGFIGGLLKTAFKSLSKASSDIGADLGTKLGDWSSSAYVGIRDFINGFASGITGKKDEYKPKH